MLSACPEQLARCFRTLSICPWPGQWCPLVLKPPSWNHSTATPINDFHPVALSPNHRQGLPDHQFTPNRSTCHIGPGPGDTPSPRPLTQPRPTWTGQNLYVRMLLTQFSSAFDTEIPSWSPSSASLVPAPPFAPGPRAFWLTRPQLLSQTNLPLLRYHPEHRRATRQRAEASSGPPVHPCWPRSCSWPEWDGGGRSYQRWHSDGLLGWGSHLAAWCAQRHLGINSMKTRNSSWTGWVWSQSHTPASPICNLHVSSIRFPHASTSLMISPGPKTHQTIDQSIVKNGATTPLQSSYLQALILNTLD